MEMGNERKANGSGNERLSSICARNSERVSGEARSARISSSANARPAGNYSRAFGPLQILLKGDVF